MTKKELVEIAKTLGLPVSGKNIKQLKEAIDEKVEKINAELYGMPEKTQNCYKGKHPITGKMIE
jgi:hypothetical protein